MNPSGLFAVCTQRLSSSEFRRTKVLPQYVEAPAGLSRLLADFQVLSRGFIPVRAMYFPDTLCVYTFLRKVSH